MPAAAEFPLVEESGADNASEGDAEQLARSIVLRQLNAAPKSRAQLERKLQERHVTALATKRVLDRFEEVGLVNDAEFAQLWVRSRSETKLLARSVLKRELTEKGVPGELVEAALAQRTDEDEAEAAQRLVEQKMPSDTVHLDRTERDKVVRRLVGMLGRKGYSPGLAFKIVNDTLTGAAPDE